MHGKINCWVVFLFENFFFPAMWKHTHPNMEITQQPKYLINLIRETNFGEGVVGAWGAEILSKYFLYKVSETLIILFCFVSRSDPSS